MNIEEKETKIIDTLRGKKWKQSHISIFDSLSPESLNICLNKKIRVYPHSITYLSLTIMFNKPEAATHLLKMGANAVGITNCGLSLDTPITFARFIDNEKDFMNMVKILLVGGASINSFGVNNETLLTYLTMSPFCTNNKIKFLLSMGANPNGQPMSRPLTNVLYQNTHILTEEKNECARTLLIQGCFIPDDFFPWDPVLAYTVEQLKLLYSLADRSEKNDIIGIEIPEIIKKIERAYGIPENKDKSLTERKEDVILLITNFKVFIKRNNSTFKEYIELFRSTQRLNGCELEFKTGNDTTLLGDPINTYGDENIYVSFENEFRWTYHMEELSNIIYSRKNPYTLKPYSENDLKNMVEKLDFFPYYSNPEEIFIKPSYQEETDTKFLNLVINSLEPYLNIENTLKIRTSLFCEIPYLFMGGIYSIVLQTCSYEGYTLASSEGKTIVLKEMSKIMIAELRMGHTNLSMITQCFNQVLGDDILCDKLLETLGVDKNDMDTIHALFSEVPIDYTENFFDPEKWAEMKKVITQCGQEFRETYVYLIDKIIKC